MRYRLKDLPHYTTTLNCSKAQSSHERPHNRAPKSAYQTQIDTAPGPQKHPNTTVKLILTKLSIAAIQDMI